MVYWSKKKSVFIKFWDPYHYHRNLTVCIMWLAHTSVRVVHGVVIYTHSITTASNITWVGPDFTAGAPITRGAATGIGVNTISAGTAIQTRVRHTVIWKRDEER